jgi:hypothetical protein
MIKQIYRTDCDLSIITIITIIVVFLQKSMTANHVVPQRRARRISGRRQAHLVCIVIQNVRVSDIFTRCCYAVVFRALMEITLSRVVLPPLSISLSLSMRVYVYVYVYVVVLLMLSTRKKNDRHEFNASNCSRTNPSLANDI